MIIVCMSLQIPIKKLRIDREPIVVFLDVSQRESQETPTKNSVNSYDVKRQ